MKFHSYRDHMRSFWELLLWFNYHEASHIFKNEKGGSRLLTYMHDKNGKLQIFLLVQQPKK